MNQLPPSRVMRERALCDLDKLRALGHLAVERAEDDELDGMGHEDVEQAAFFVRAAIE